MLAVVLNADPGAARQQGLGCQTIVRAARRTHGCRRGTGRGAGSVVLRGVGCGGSHGYLFPGSEMKAIFFSPAWRAWAMAVITNS